MTQKIYWQKCLTCGPFNFSFYLKIQNLIDQKIDAFGDCEGETVKNRESEWDFDREKEREKEIVTGKGGREEGRERERQKKTKVS